MYVTEELELLAFRTPLVVGGLLIDAYIRTL